MSLFDAFGEITEIEYTFDFGDGEDMDGIDLKFRLPNGELKTMQIKSGTFQNMGDEFHVNGSQNNLKYSTDYYGYAKADDWKRFTSVIIFENTPNLYKDDKTIIVKKEYEIYNKIQHMPIPEKLNELLVLCGRKDIEFILKKEDGDNTIDYNNESKKIKILTGFSDKGGSTNAFVNLTNEFNKLGYDCTLYGPHSWHLVKCQSKLSNELDFKEPLLFPKNKVEGFIIKTIYYDKSN
jgi:hypothetical protein